MRRFILLFLLLASALAVFPSPIRYGPASVTAATSPSFTLLANIFAWNNSQPSGPNPTVQSAQLFARLGFSLNIRWVDNTHNLAIYQPGTLPGEVSFLNPCSSTPKCVTESQTVTSASPQATLSAVIASPGVYEYYCELHPSSMHGKLRINRSPDINGDTLVNIIDLAAVGAAFGSTPASANWNPNADLNLDNTINIIDLATVAANFGQTVP